MGCCLSRPEGPNSPYPGGAPSASARAINVPPGGASSAAGASGGSANAVAGEILDVTSSSSSSPSTIASQRLRSAAAAAVPPNVSRLPPPQETLAIHINKPLRRRRWTSRNRVWTRHSIDRERTDFFDTRVTGRAEIWQTLRTALEILWEADLVAATQRLRGGGSGGDDTETATEGATTTAAAAAPATPTSPASPTRRDEGEAAAGGSTEAAEARATAQTILDAADITLPTGDMAQGAYDAFGNFYALPAWIVSDPTNLDDDPEHDLDDTKGMLDDMDGEGHLSAGESDVDRESFEEEDDDDDDDDDDGDETCGDEVRRHHHPRIRRRREEKGKAVLVAAHQIAVRARLSVSARDVVIHLGREETVRSLAHRISEEAKLPHTTRIRIAYLGKILKEGAPLTAQGWKEGHVVNALVFGATA